ncbi:PilZ domain-containing protein [Massilia sp. TS11]|nr:PilZ domain-containing protein [Massilia sp. TS11]
MAVNARLHREGGASLPARTLDVSSTGISLLVGQSLPFHEPWTISFDMFVEGQPHAVSLLAEVQQMIVGSDGVRIGFQFKRMSMASMIAISRYVGEGATLCHF